jgi:cytochrome c-type biogenesis protein
MPTDTPSIGLAFAGGILTILSPCVLPVLPIILGRSLQSHRWGPIVLVTGLVTGFSVAGSLLGFTASWFTNAANILRQVAIATLLVLGLLTLFPKWSYRLFSALPISRWTQGTGVGLTGEFWIGAQLGLLWTPCAGPVLGAILVLAAANHAVLSAFWLLFAYGMGTAIPLLLIAYGGRRMSQSFLRLRSQSERLQQVGGIMIVMTAIAIILGWDIQLQLWLAPLFPKLPL